MAMTNKNLETKLSKIQADFAELNAKVIDLDQRLAKEQARTRSLEAERDAMANRLKSRTDERDQVQQQFDGLVKTLESALGTVKAARANSGNDQLPVPRAVLSSIKVVPGGS
ncbi:MAG: hypothetical protein U0798_12890 [Gemmataceae bacterium]